MNRFLLQMIVTACFATPAITQQAPATQPITIAELNQRQVIGALGVPLGTVVEVRATVVSGEELGGKGNDTSYLLKVTHVNGKELENAPLMEFSVFPTVRAELANNPFDLYEKKRGQKAQGLSSEQIAELEKGYVGKTVNLAVYEVGRFSGIPRNMPSGSHIWLGRAFQFSTDLNVLVDRGVEARRKQQNFSKGE